MFKAKKTGRSKKQKKTPAEIEEEHNRTLYVRLPHTIRNVVEIKNLFFGDFKVKLPRQSTRYCHVIFADLEGKIKNLKAAKEKLIDEKPIYVGPPKPINLEKKKKPKQKKVVIPPPKVEPKIKKYLFISNIPPGVKASEVKDAFPGAVTVVLMKGLVKGKRLAKLKMSSSTICLHYAENKDNWPLIKGHKVSVSLSKKNSSNKIRKEKKTESLKIYNGGSEQNNQSKVKDSDSKSVDTGESDEDDDNEEEDTNETEEDEEEEVEEEDEEEEEEEEESSSEEE